MSTKNSPVPEVRSADFRKFKLKKVSEQISLLREMFPYIKGAAPIHQGAEGFFAFPDWEDIDSKSIIDPTYPYHTYRKALLVIFELIAQKIKFVNGLVWLGQDRLRRNQTTEKFEKFIRKQKEKGQKNKNIFIFPAQFGDRYFNKSAVQARKGMEVSEFLLGSFEIGIWILTHFEDIHLYDGLRMMCGGDERRPTSDGDFNYVTYYNIYSDKIEFGHCAMISFKDYIFPSAFLPQPGPSHH